MSDPQRRIFLVGPQPNYSSLKVVIDRIELRALALITAGWETEEQQDRGLKEAAGGPCINLHLFARTEQLFAEDRELIQKLRDRQDELRHLRDVYNERLGHLLKAARQVIRRQNSLVDLNTECESAIEMVRQLDRQYFVRTSQIIDRYENELRTAERPLVIAHRQEIAEILSHTSALVIAGGHVAIILNRLKLFGVLDVIPTLPIIACSGGAMALAEQVVFYHDSPPQGRRNPELLRAGMGVFSDILPLPDGNSRLALNDATRVELFARRFSAFDCVLFGQQTILERTEGQWKSVGHQPAQQLSTCGSVVEFRR